MRTIQRDAAAIGDAWVFPSSGNAANPVSRYVTVEWWNRLEKLAGLKHVPGRGWHSLRRRFATDLDHLPLKKLMGLGGWKTTQTVVRYQKHTTEQLREALKTRQQNVAGV